MKRTLAVTALGGMTLVFVLSCAAFAQQKPLKPKASPIDALAGNGQSGEETLEALLDETGLLYQRQTGNNNSVRYRIAVEASGETTMITARVHTWKWKRRDLIGPWDVMKEGAAGMHVSCARW